MRLLSIVFIALAGASPSFSQDVANAQHSKLEQIGTLNGHPVFALKDLAAIDFADRQNRQPTPEDQQQITALAVKDACRVMSDRLMQVVWEQLKQQFAISIAPEEVAQTTETMIGAHEPNLDIVAWRQKWTAYYEAVHQVFDLHQDPEQVYQKLIARLEQDQVRGHKFFEDTLVHWSTPEGRAQLAYIAQSPTISQAITKDVQMALEKQKIDDAVDSELAAGDPQFASYVEEWRKTAILIDLFQRSSGLLFARETSSMPNDHLDYLNQKRHQFWMERYAQQQIMFADPKVAAYCNLGSGKSRKDGTLANRN